MSNSKPRVSIIIEGFLNPFGAKGGMKDLQIIIDCLSTLGYSLTIYARLLDGLSKEEALAWLGVDLIQLQPATSLAKFKQLNKQQLLSISNQRGGIAIFMGMGAIKMVSPPEKALTIFIPSLPEHMLIFSRLIFALKTSKVGILKIIYMVMMAGYDYAREYLNLFISKKIVDIVLAQDPNNAQMHRHCSRLGVWHYPSPLTDFAHSNSLVVEKEKTILLSNAPGTHSDSAIEYFCNEIAPNITRRDYRFLQVGRDVWPESILKLEDKINISNLPFINKFEDSLRRCSCLLFTSTIPVGASTRVKTALMCATVPIVHPSVLSGLPELIPNYNCLVGHNGPEFVTHINRIMDDENFREEMSKNARATYNKFFTLDVAEEFWRSILSQINLDKKFL